MGASLRIVRQRIYHQGTFEVILKRLAHMSRCCRAGGRYWELVFSQGGVRIYRPAEYDPEWLRERLEQYEHYFYQSLAGGFCGRDGLLRSRTHNVRPVSGGFRQVSRRTI